MSIRFDAIGLPIIQNDVMVRAHGVNMNDSHLILTTIITTMIFLNILLFFTLVFNISTRGIDDTDYNFFQFAVYFTVFNFFFVSILMVIKNQYL